MTAKADPNVTTIKVRAGGRDAEPVEVRYHIGSSLDELVSQFGDKLVASKAREKIIINLQDYIRNHAKKGSDDLQGLADKWVPGIRAAGASKVEKAKSLFDSLSPEDKKALLESMS